MFYTAAKLGYAKGDLTLLPSILLERPNYPLAIEVTMIHTITHVSEDEIK
jgi:hypothetical protein